jgi:hypothetical protein
MDVRAASERHEWAAGLTDAAAPALDRRARVQYVRMS